jgi:hypothetical protein
VTLPLAVSVAWIAAGPFQLPAAGTTHPLVECRVDGEGDSRVWQLARLGEGTAQEWYLTLQSSSPGARIVHLPLPSARVTSARGRVTASSASSNGGIAVELVADASGSMLDVFVNFELEVNVWRDLSPDVEKMNTGGPRRDVRCTILPAHIAEGASEWMVSAGTGWSIPILKSASGHHYVFPSISWGRVLTGPRGPGLLRGRFAWGVEVLPFFAQYHPVRSHGFGFSPLLWRWSFEPRGQLAPFVELGGGGLWTGVDLPGETTRANYTAHVTLAVRLLQGRARGAVVGYRFDHISNGNRVDPNPGVNAHVMVIGWTMLRPRR